MSDQAPITLRVEDYAALDKAAGGELEKLLRALNLNTQIATSATSGLQAAAALGDRWRVREGPYPTPTSPVCILIQNRIGTTWTTVQAIDASGRLSVRTAWTFAPASLNGWVNYNYPTYAPLSYCQSCTGEVHVRGAIQSGTIGQPAILLPAGLRVGQRIVLPASSSNGVTDVVADVDINADGTIAPRSGSNVFFSFYVKYLPEQ